GGDVVWAGAGLITVCTSRKKTAPTAVVRCTACAMIRCRGPSRIRSCATSPQITEQLRQTSDRTPTPKLRKSTNQSSAVLSSGLTTHLRTSGRTAGTTESQPTCPERGVGCRVDEGSWGQLRTVR